MKEEVFCKDLAALHDWLEANHQKSKGCWLVFYKGEKRTMSWGDIVDELLCFGWIDSTAGKVGDDKTKLWISPRKDKSHWSRVNKEKIDSLINAARMKPAGLKMVALAKKTGTWDALNDVDNLVIPDDLAQELTKYPQAQIHFEAFPPSAKRAILQWIFSAKRPETRTKRIHEAAKKAQENLRAMG